MPYSLILLSGAEAYIDSLPDKERVAVDRDLSAMAVGRFELVKTRQLRGPIRELKVGVHRLTYFQINGVSYMVNGFRKKGTKAPRMEIKYSEKIYKLMVS